MKAWGLGLPGWVVVWCRLPGTDHRTWSVGIGLHTSRSRSDTDPHMCLPYLHRTRDISGHCSHYWPEVRGCCPRRIFLAPGTDSERGMLG